MSKLLFVAGRRAQHRLNGSPKGAAGHLRLKPAAVANQDVIVAIYQVLQRRPAIVDRFDCLSAME
jgi:hypothetical protein